MDQTPNGSPKTDQPTKQWVIKILIAAIILVLVFIAFNYINAYSKQRNIKKTVVTNAKNVPSTFRYDNKKAETLLTQYIKENIKPEFLPATIEIKQQVSIDGQSSGLPYEFSWNYRKNNVSFATTFHYKENTNVSDGFSIFIQPSNVNSSSTTETLAESLTSYYFINSYSPISKCSSGTNASYCENFQVQNDGKRGFGIALGRGTYIVFSCFFPKDSKNYNLSSCITP